MNQEVLAKMPAARDAQIFQENTEMSCVNWPILAGAFDNMLMRDLVI